MYRRSSINPPWGLGAHSHLDQICITIIHVGITEGVHPLSLQVVEVVLAVSALTKGLFTVVASSLLGSILSNLLLVMGECKSTQSIPACCGLAGQIAFH